MPALPAGTGHGHFEEQGHVHLNDLPFGQAGTEYGEKTCPRSVFPQTGINHAFNAELDKEKRMSCEDLPTRQAGTGYADLEDFPS